MEEEDMTLAERIFAEGYAQTEPERRLLKATLKKLEEECRLAKLEAKQAKDARVKGLLNMLEKGFSIEEIASFTGLDLEDTKRLINSYRPQIC